MSLNTAFTASPTETAPQESRISSTGHTGTVHPSFFPVVETESAIAVFPGVSVWAAVPAAASLYAAGRAFHNCLHTVWEGVLVKYIFSAPFREMKKARSLLQNFGLRQ